MKIRKALERPVVARAEWRTPTTGFSPPQRPECADVCPHAVINLAELFF
ncbi:MAG TPA: hypothetical protein P5102_09660 [Candidatus Competibacteraceae bacterium]|nr:hypothetical protein [Candidatus Competibacteraceae bacterium]HRZ06400.1 hypothetical protein [Candidatus Competibacteraceae bacterium]HSA45181.1 hypothetical protein [Candidatus Competibacteraceae bacterium]